MRRAAALGLVLCASWGCTEVYLRAGRIEGVKEVIVQALEAGAVRCAPQEVALAQAHIQFATTELDQGHPERAEEHLVIGEANARAALRLSPKDQCAHDRPGDKDGDGIADSDDKCPTNPEDHDAVEDGDGCPEDQDSDGDNIADSVDLCVAATEDADGYLDSDGCPDEDNDVDLIPDVTDKCPLEPEDPDTFLDEDGCPDADNDNDGLLDVNDACPNEHGLESTQGCPKVYRNVVVTDAAVVIKEQVHFATNKAVIRPESFGLLDTVAQALNDFPAIRVEVQGHTDDKGSDRKNLKLSQQRADAVRSYLIGRGIEPFRMTAVGYGEQRPIDSNKSESGRAANRRVEFVRTDENAHKPGPAPGADQEGGVP